MQQIDIKIEDNIKMRQQTHVCFISEYTEIPNRDDSLYKIFKGKWKESLCVPQQEGIDIYIGTGRSEGAEPVRVKELFAKLMKIIRQHQLYEVSVDIEPLIRAWDSCETETMFRHAVTGLILGGYEEHFCLQMREKTVVHKEQYLICLQGIDREIRKEMLNAVQEGMTLADAVWFTRNMVNCPGNMLRPEDFVRQVRTLFEGLPVDIHCLDVDEIRMLKMGGLLAVGESSRFSPKLLIINYTGDAGSSERTGIVGKGVTCDTGGYCLKSADSLAGIKGDMAGGASAAAAIYAAVVNKSQRNLTGIIPLCENRISDGSLLPGDVITAMSGQTIEIVNTDAEGRLILADAVTYAVEKAAVTRILDIATLTGAVVSMFGFLTTAAVTNDDELFEQMFAAGQKSGERFVRIPCYPEHENMLKSRIADMKNMGGKIEGTLAAALFIRQFAKGLPWIHLDIAGTAWLDEPVYEYHTKGATGACVETLYELCMGKDD